jgi:hypothetical protein
MPRINDEQSPKLFRFLGHFLAWKVGSGRKVRIGFDVIVGCGDNIFLSDNLVDHLCEWGIYALNHIGDITLSSILHQHWLTTEYLGMTNNWEEEWSQYTIKLRQVDVHIIEAKDDLVWNYPNASVRYSTNMVIK